MPGRIYWISFKNAKPQFNICWEMEDFGVTNLGFGAHENFATFATTRGVYYTWQHGNMFSQRRCEMPADVFFTALGYRQFIKELRPNDSRTRSTTYAAPFSGKGQSPVYCVPERTTGKWSILSGNAQIKGQGKAVNLNAGISCILPDKAKENTIYLCNRHGIFKSTDLGKSYECVYRSAP